MTDKQRGWNAALNLVIDKFGSVAWQNELDEEKRKRAAADMEKLVEYAVPRGSLRTTGRQWPTW